MVLRRKMKKCPRISPYDAFDEFTFHSMRKHSCWEECRECLTSDFKNTKNKDFVCTGKPKRINRIINFIEELLNLKQRYRSNVYPVDSPKYTPTYNDPIPTLSYISPSQFWTANPIRLEFLTALIKGLDGYSGKSYFKAIMGIEYFMDVPRATAMFLTGHTLPPKSPELIGWTDIFLDVVCPKRVYSTEETDRVDFQAGLEKLNQMLRKPSTKKECRFFRRNNPTTRLTLAQKNQLRLWIQHEEHRKIPKSHIKKPSPFSQPC